MKIFNQGIPISFFSISIVIILISTVASLITIAYHDSLNKEVLKTQAVSKQLESLSYSIVDVEASCRAYFITSDTLHLQEYVYSVEETRKNYQRLKFIIEKENEQVFHDLLVNRFSLLDSGIYHMIIGGKVPSETIRKGNLAMEKVEQHIKNIEDKQRIKLEGEIALLRRQSDLSKLFILTLGLVAVVMTHNYRKRLNKSKSKNDRQNAIINTIPANIAILSAAGVITSVNDRWVEFARENGFKGDNFGVGESYLHVSATNSTSNSAKIFDGISSVITNKNQYYSSEYECSSPEKERWFRLMLVPLKGREVREYIVMHIDITEAKIAERKILQKEQKLRTIAVMNSHEIRKPLANILGLLDVMDTVTMEDRGELLLLIKESAVELDEKVKGVAAMAN